MGGILEEVKSFRIDKFGTWYYDSKTKKVSIFIQQRQLCLDPSVLIEMLAGAIIDISIVQTSNEETTQK